ncbi:MAG: glycosyltransferase [Pyrobaculum aerophilum]|nr:glycosyltransferase [Pyrobaculum aerophilum]MCX8137675.1 glycosyltransferase [Pyrobaculum aerophilum]
MILPSGGEAFSITTLEAMACGTPPVVSNAVPEEVLVDGVNGIRLNSLNPIDYADALEKVLKDDELWANLSKNGRKFAENFDHVKIASQYTAIVSAILKDFDMKRVSL